MIEIHAAGLVVVDISIAAACFETSRPTTHDNPTFVVAGVVALCVTKHAGRGGPYLGIALNNATYRSCWLWPITLARGARPRPHLRDGLKRARGRSCTRRARAWGCGRREWSRRIDCPVER